MRLLASLVLGLMLFQSAKASEVSLQIGIRHTFNGETLSADSLRYQNADGETLSVTRLDYLLSDFAVQKADATWAELPGQVAWISEEHGRTTFILKNVPAGIYQTLRFCVGLDPATNAANPMVFPADSPLNPNLNDLHWNWQGGYIFLALEGYHRRGNEMPGGYVYHLARNPSLTHISLAAPLDLRTSSAITLDFDVATLLNGPRPISFDKDGVATHSRNGDPVSATLTANLPAAFRLRNVSSLAPAITQSSTVQPLFQPGKFTPFPFVMSRTFPIPDLPRDNPLITERVALGEKLFHETALSRTGTLSCASCHQEANAYSDPRRYSLGVSGQAGARHAMPLFNLAWKSDFFWDGRTSSLRLQALVPIQNHAEMDETLDRVVAKLLANSRYPDLFVAAFGSTEITPQKIGLALEQYVLTLTSFDSKFDRAMKGQATLNADEKRGFQLFMTEYDPRTGQYGADCFHCHGGAMFTDHQFHNDGLDSESLLVDDPGRSMVTGRPSDLGKFATPSLRNVELTGPYMHDGRFSTLEEVVEHYSTGMERSSTLDPNLAKHPGHGLPLSDADKKALVAFLKTLTDPKFRKIPASNGAVATFLEPSK